MPGVQRMGDANSAGGVITSGDKTVLVNKRPIATIGLSVSAHPPCPIVPKHCNAKTTIAIVRSVRVNKLPIISTGDNDTCSHMRVGGSPNVKVGINLSPNNPPSGSTSR
jgi:uncharacterized Zn-binding protein involved in type VI secretion